MAVTVCPTPLPLLLPAQPQHPVLVRRGITGCPIMADGAWQTEVDQQALLLKPPAEPPLQHRLHQNLLLFLLLQRSLHQNLLHLQPSLLQLRKDCEDKKYT